MSVTVERDGRVLLIGVNRPERRNAWNLDVIDAVGEAYAEFAADPALRCAVLFGHGDHFSAGLDLAEVGPIVTEQGPVRISGNGPYDPFGIWRPPVPKPVVIAIQGIAFTLSVELALASDIVVAADDVRFSQLEIARGIMPFGGAAQRAALQLGWGNAMRYLLTAEEFGAETALRIGLAQEVVPAGQQLARATELAHLVGEQSPLGVQMTLDVARTSQRAAAEAAGTARLAELLPQLLASKDAEEGRASFIERRKANFE